MTTRHDLNSTGTGCAPECPACNQAAEVALKQLRVQLRAAIWNRIKETMSRLSAAERGEAEQELKKLSQRLDDTYAKWKSAPKPVTEPTIIPWL